MLSNPPLRRSVKILCEQYESEEGSSRIMSIEEQEAEARHTDPDGRGKEGRSHPVREGERARRCRVPYRRVPPVHGDQDPGEGRR